MIIFKYTFQYNLSRLCIDIKFFRRTNFYANAFQARIVDHYTFLYRIFLIEEIDFFYFFTIDSNPSRS